jgi:hypothetical protein
MRRIDHTVVRAAIHPAIGIARVGNSEEHFFIGPEVDEPLPGQLGEPASEAFSSGKPVESSPGKPEEPPSDKLEEARPDESDESRPGELGQFPPGEPSFYKDRTGALKRQAARFRVYGYNAAGEVVAELTAEQADIKWSVHVANRKAAWYQFQIALDIPEASFPDAQPTQLRNADVIGEARDQLVIDPGARTIQGRDQVGPQHRFDSGEFCGKKVYLGELRTDEAGRLIFLGGRGVSASNDGSPATTFANNDKWHDDVSDGPVTAEVTIDGRSIPVDPAWVIVAPPNYAPDVVGVRTMYDLLYDTYVQCGWIPFPQRVSFSRHILPLLTRLVGLQWVNHGFATRFGFGGTEHFLAPAYLERLASPLLEHAELRQQVWAAFREWERDGESPLPWPWLYGDSMSLPPVSPRQHTMLTATQLSLLERWVTGEFEADLDLGEDPPRAIEEVPLAEQPTTLDRAALTFCLADAFHPGCEMTWPMRHPSMYMAPFRLRHRPIGDAERSWGTTLTPEAVMSPDGPLYGQAPGSISRWMAVPWQTDTASCLSGYDPGYGRRYDPYLPTFWPARVPNQVLAARDYDAVVDETRPLSERRTAFERRAVWLRWLEGRYTMQINQMVRDFGKLGVVETRPGPEDGHFPRRILVESEVGFERQVNSRRNLRPLHVPDARDPATAEIAIARAMHARGVTDEEVVAGYIEKVDRFPRAGH